MSIPQDVIESLTGMFANAIQKAFSDASSNTSTTATGKPPVFSISEYSTTHSTTVKEYFTRFDWALELSSVPLELHAQYARVNMGAELNSALRILVSPLQPETLSYEDLKKVLINHFDAVRNKFAESIKFRQITQSKDESVASFALRLKQAATHCEYDTFLDRMLIEQLLHGLESREICNKIITKKPDTFSAAYEIAQSLEITRNTSNEVNRAEQMPLQESTNKLGFSPPKFKNKTKQMPKQALSVENRGVLTICNGCGGQHLRKNCKFISAECFSCGKRGHISKVCKSKTSQLKENDSVQSDTDDVYTQSLNKLNIDKVTDRKMLNVQIDGRSIKMELDTGAPCGIISIKTLRSIKNHFSLQKSDRQFSSYSRHRISCVGRLPVTVKIGNT